MGDLVKSTLLLKGMGTILGSSGEDASFIGSKDGAGILKIYVLIIQQLKC